jgi:guanosine-3',5'-bis(diphosphate) 3'-pyrophosphohydrolase
MKYRLRIYDNYHYADESEAYDHGNFSSYQKAEQTAKKIVDEFLESGWQRGMKPDILVAYYVLYGEDPVIIPSDNPEGKSFSARDYAREAAKTICLELETRAKRNEVQSVYQEAIKFASLKHLAKSQTVKGTNLPYVVHLSNVAMEIFMAAKHTRRFDLIFAVQLALLHDTLEDTETTPEEIIELFGKAVADGVSALSKDKDLPKEEQLSDSLQRIKIQPMEVWAVKLADRITNLQPAPRQWSVEKRKSYVVEAQLILDELGEANDYLANRLRAKIAEYRNQNKAFLLDDF